MESLHVEPGGRLAGVAALPGDKSISQRAAIFAAMAQGTTRIEGYLESEDALNTLSALEALGAGVERDGTSVTIRGVGEAGFSDPEIPLDLGNSGTGARLLLGALAGQSAFAVLYGDASLSRRPMGRVVRPLRQMGAKIDGRRDGELLPLVVHGRALKAERFVLPVASAQVKSAILLAGLGARGTTVVQEPAPSRDHTERMLPLFGVPMWSGPAWAELHGPATPRAMASFRVPRDPSSAAFPVVAALLSQGSEVVCEGVSINPTRSGWLEALKAMGADLEVSEESGVDGEPVGRITARGSELVGTEIRGELVPRAIDEIPILCVAAARARGRTVIRDASELRVKESDRLTVICREWAKLGLEVREHPDGLEIEGPQTIRGGRCESHGDHRIAMALAVAGIAATGPVVIDDASCIRASFPTFVETMASLGASIAWRSGAGERRGAAN